jgi:molybdopterin converting factor subunit 1
MRALSLTSSRYDSKMRCEVLLFAQARDSVGRNRLTLELSDGASVSDALDALLHQHPALQVLRNRLAVAMDNRYASPHTPLCDGCTIALIPPVSGG